jgi:hypothetical protein
MPQLAVKGPKAAQAADLASMAMDLDHVVMACDWLVANLPEDQTTPNAHDATENTIWRCVWESAVIAYGRCFTSGRGHLGNQKRTRIPPEILEGLPEEQQTLHEAIITERNQHVGHRVDPMAQQARILVMLNGPYNPPAVAGAGPLLIHRLIQPEMPSKLSELADCLRTALKARSDGLVAEVAGEVGENLIAAYQAASPRYPMVVLRSNGQLLWGDPPDDEHGASDQPGTGESPD